MKTTEEFSEKTTLHGPAHFFEAISSIEKVIWAILILTFTCLAIWQVVVLTKEFTAKEVVTAVSNKMGKDISDQFSLTYCPEDWLDIGKVITDEADILGLLYALQGIPMLDFYPVRELELLYSKMNGENHGDFVVCRQNLVERNEGTTANANCDPGRLTQAVINTNWIGANSVIGFNEKKHSQQSLGLRLFQLLNRYKVSTIEQLIIKFAKTLDVPAYRAGVNSTKVVMAGKVCHRTPLTNSLGNSLEFVYFHGGVIVKSAPSFAFTMHEATALTYSYLGSLSFENNIKRDMDEPFVPPERCAAVKRLSNEKYSLSIRKFIHLHTSTEPCSPRASTTDVQIDDCMAVQELTRNIPTVEEAALREAAGTIVNIIKTEYNQSSDVPKMEKYHDLARYNTQCSGEAANWFHASFMPMEENKCRKLIKQPCLNIQYKLSKQVTHDIGLANVDIILLETETHILPYDTSRIPGEVPISAAMKTKHDDTNIDDATDGEITKNNETNTNNNDDGDVLNKKDDFKNIDADEINKLFNKLLKIESSDQNKTPNETNGINERRKRATSMQYTQEESGGNGYGVVSKREIAQREYNKSNSVCNLNSPCMFYRYLVIEIDEFLIFEESTKMTKSQYLGSAGGLFGLYIGASFMSLAHLIIFCGSKVFSKITGRSGEAIDVESGYD